MSNYFYHKLLRKYVIVIGSLFDGIQIENSNGTFVVPINYIDKDKLIQMYLRREKSYKGFSITMPRISYTLGDMYYQPQKKLNRIHKYVDSTGLSSLYTPVPYDISVEMNVIANRTRDITQIVEQILPLFTPDIKITANLIPDLDISLDLSLGLNNVWVKDNYEGNLTDKRFIVYTFDFKLSAYFFNRIIEESEDKIIHTATANLYELGASTKDTTINAYANNEITYE